MSIGSFLGGIFGGSSGGSSGVGSLLENLQKSQGGAGIGDLLGGLGGLGMGMPKLGRAMPEEHKGLFGISGTPRNILGMIGDALMVGQGGQPLYTQGVRGEKIGDATKMMDLDPMAAIQRIAGIDPKLGQEYLADYQKEQGATAKREGDQRNDDRTYGLNRDRFAFDRGKEFNPVAAGYITTATEQSWPMVRDKTRAAYKNMGIEPPFEIPDTWSPDIKNQWGNQAVDPKAQYQQGQQNYRTEAGITAANGRNAAGIEAANSRHEGTLGVGTARLNETNRHNTVVEGQGQQKIDNPPSNRRPARGANTTSTIPVGTVRVFKGKKYTFKGGNDRDRNTWVAQ